MTVDAPPQYLESLTSSDSFPKKNRETQQSMSCISIK
jgi:hypothetical protein